MPLAIYLEKHIKAQQEFITINKKCRFMNRSVLVTVYQVYRFHDSIEFSSTLVELYGPPEVYGFECYRIIESRE
jgi:hypothetical protein